MDSFYYQGQDLPLLDMQLEQYLNRKEFRINVLSFSSVPDYLQHIINLAQSRGFSYSNTGIEYVFSKN